MNQMMSNIAEFMEDAIEVLQVNGLVVKADAYKLLGEVQAALAEPQREWVGLTDEGIAELRRNGAHSVSDTDFRAIETWLKELNT